jgi:hypothetical protein
MKTSPGLLAQQPDVMNAVQQMRLKADQAGKLASTSQQRVTTTNDGGRPIIDIEPANPQMMYVPNYDPGYIWGSPLYYPYANWYYPPFYGGAYFGFGLGINMGLYFGGGWGGWGGWGWRPGWGNGSVIVNNSFIHRYNLNAARGASLSGNSNWSHDASHRAGVPYSNAAVSSRYGGAVRQNLQSRGAAAGGAQSRDAQSRDAQSRGAASASRSAAGSERMGNRQVAPNSSNANRSAFGGVRDGSAARTQSDHGYSSLGPSRSSGGGGSSRSSGGGGGGGGHGGGGGGRR